MTILNESDIYHFEQNKLCQRGKKGNASLFVQLLQLEINYVESTP